MSFNLSITISPISLLLISFLIELINEFSIDVTTFSNSSTETGRLLQLISIPFNILPLSKDSLVSSLFTTVRGIVSTLSYVVNLSLHSGQKRLRLITELSSIVRVSTTFVSEAPQKGHFIYLFSSLYNKLPKTFPFLHYK